MFDQLLKVINDYWRSFLYVMPKFGIALIILAAAVFIARYASRFVSNRISKRLDDQLLARFLCRITKWIIVTVGIAMAMNTVGLGGIAGTIVAGAGVSAFIIGFALKDIGENFLSGIILAFDRPFSIGDTIQTGDLKGKVVSLNLRSTYIRSSEGKDIFIPNSNLLKNPLINHTRGGHVRYEFTIGVDYESDIDRARSLIVGVISSLENISKDYAPVVAIESIEGSSIKLRILFWVDSTEPSSSVVVLRSEVMKHTKDVLVKNNFKIQ